MEPRTYEEYLQCWFDEGEQPASRQVWEAQYRYHVAQEKGRRARDMACRCPERAETQDVARHANAEERAAFRAYAAVCPGVTPVQGGLT